MAITTVAEAIKSLQSGIHPAELSRFLQNKAVFRVLVKSSDQGAAKLITYYALEFVGTLRFQSTKPDPGVDNAELKALLIPTTPGKKIFEAGCFPNGSFGTIDPAAPGGVQVICTEQLSGCTLAFGWDKRTGLLHIGHAEPDENIKEISTRAELCNYLQKQGGFQGLNLSPVDILFVGGGAINWSDYDGDRANVIAFVAANKVTIIVQIVRNNKEFISSWVMEFPPK